MLNAALVGTTLSGFAPDDWRVLERASREAGTAALYADRGTGTFMWSPVGAYVLQFITPLGLWAWRLVLFLAALAMPTWRLRLLVLVSWPFWVDIATGNLVTVIFLAAVWALHGSKIGTVAFFAVALLVPRPLLAPLALWILWRRPEWRWPFAGMLVAHGLLVVWTGLGPAWIASLAAIGPELQSFYLNLSPTRFIGWWWMIVGTPLALWLTVHGRLGWAGLAISPYIWIYYLFWAFPDTNHAHDVGPRERSALGA